MKEQHPEFNYYNKPELVEAIRAADKPLVEVPTSWEFEGGKEEEDEEGSSPPSPEGDIAEQLLEDLDHYLPPWNDGLPVGYNPHVGLARAARLAQPPLGLPISSELRGQFGSKLIVYQFFWRGLAWCRKKEYDNIHIVRY